jgi:ubiquinone/menaquinone biosynthesis C-methylase UbiE
MLFGEVTRMAKQHSAKRSAAAEVNNRVRAQFGAAAAAYTSSGVHRDAEALRKVVELARPEPGDLALDIATGAGHVALALAPYVTRVIAYDMTEEMLVETQRNATARGLSNVVTRRGTAEQLPFPDATFDIVAVRFAAHHFGDAPVAIREMARVAKIGARVVIVDSTSPEDQSLDRQWNQIEKLRDPSHVWSYPPSVWRGMVAGAGLRISFEAVDHCTENGGPMNFRDWTQRINTRPDAVDELRQIFRTASPALVEALRVQTTAQEICFCVPQIWIAAIK